MKIAETATLVDFNIKGVPFTVPHPFVEGHVLTEGEARVLNQTFKENIRNNFNAVVVRALEAAAAEGSEVDVAELQEALEAYIAEYEFGQTAARASSKTSPLDREIERLARQVVVNAIKAKGLKVKDIDADKVESFVAQVIASKGDVLRAEAEKVLAARASTAGISLDFDA
jgi:hypothetical protein